MKQGSNYFKVGIFNEHNNNYKIHLDNYIFGSFLNFYNKRYCFRILIGLD